MGLDPFASGRLLRGVEIRPKIVLGREGQVDRSRASVDPASLGAKGGQGTGPSPVNRGKPGTKRHVIVDAKGLPLAVLLSGANRHDALLLLPPLDAVPPVASRRGPRRRQPERLHPDKAYDHQTPAEGLAGEGRRLPHRL